MTTKFKDFSSMPGARDCGAGSRISPLRGWNFTKVSPIGNDKRPCRYQTRIVGIRTIRIAGLCI
jgi:hypothetical protein